MPQPLDGIRVAIIENRYPEQLTQLLTRLGAEVFSCPLLKETPIEDSSGARRFISLCEQTEIDYIVFYTGVGVDILFRSVTKPETIARARILARGPKAVHALKRVGMRVDLVAESATTEGILRTLSREDLKGKTVLVQLYGQENTELSAPLQKLGATVIGVSLYSYTQASETSVIKELVARIMDGRLDAIAFTSATQVPFFFRAAEKLADPAVFRKSLEKVVIASVGEVTSRALRSAGVEPRVVPTESKMGPMVKALGEFFEQHRGAVPGE
jgi:uroporphyrinogen-III synthase